MTDKAPARILFIADAGPQVGGGHVMRCLTLARALSHRGAECGFVETRAAAPILRRFGWPAQTSIAMVDAPDVDRLVALAEMTADLFEVDILVIDHYGLDVGLEQRLGHGARRVVVIDDLADRPHDCELIIDPGYGRKREAYLSLAPHCHTVLAGPMYALVRPEFADARPRALSRRAKHPPVHRGLISLGLTDVGGLTRRVVAALASEMGEMRLDVVLGSGAASLPALEAMVQTDRRLHLWVDHVEMASLMGDADIAIGAGGSSVWERAAVGLPSATLILADNQRAMAQRMADAGLTLAVDAAAPDLGHQLVRAWRTLTDDLALRWRFTERSADLCDGQGADRIAEAILRL
ncbi:MAG: UDP-2,4-diacetamido-2,4,6-trideoxy-beta-L-altropyranose hydrolase [Caulobacterales bacterium]